MTPRVPINLRRHRHPSSVTFTVKTGAVPAPPSFASPRLSESIVLVQNRHLCACCHQRRSTHPFFGSPIKYIGKFHLITVENVQGMIRGFTSVIHKHFNIFLNSNEEWSKLCKYHIMPSFEARLLQSDQACNDASRCSHFRGFKI